ncbi:MAG TPA: peroxidase-related enzyme [Flavilitoribacter sp.]|nr:peroxidase-related enzyme [Flavilitoribacter sp.]HMQ89390.1 peroxidase-related enzyme [Flavilitoribacter sp.]
MTWIKTITYAEAAGYLRQLYNRVKGPGGLVDNVLTIHSLRPHTLHGHMTLYKNVLHHRDNELPKWYLETAGVFVSMLNGCSYCVDHHSAGLKRLLNEDERHRQLVDALAQKTYADVLDDRYTAGLCYAEKLTFHPAEMEESDVVTLREAGFSDGEILELNQVISYFCYVNRTVLGLGVTTEGDILGLSPGDGADEENWHHQ